MRILFIKGGEGQITCTTINYSDSISSQWVTDSHKELRY